MHAHVICILHVPRGIKCAQKAYRFTIIMVRPVYHYNVDEDARGPVAINLRVITHGGANATDAQRIGAIVDVMRQGVVNTIRQIRPEWSPVQVLENVEGMLSATNLVNGQQQIAEGHMISARNLNINGFFGTCFKHTNT